MTAEPVTRGQRWVLWLGRLTAVGVLIMMFVFIWKHQPRDAYDPNVVSTMELHNLDAADKSASYMKDAASLVLTVTFGLTALVGLSLKNGFGRSPQREAVLLAATALFVFFVSHVILYSYDFYLTLAAQFEASVVFIQLAQQPLVSAAEALCYSAPFSFLVFALKAGDRHE